MTTESVAPAEDKVPKQLPPMFCELCGEKTPELLSTCVDGCVYKACEICWSEKGREKP